MSNQNNTKTITRRRALAVMGLVGAAAAVGLSKSDLLNLKKEAKNGTLKVDTRKDKNSGAYISLLGYGCMRFPTTPQKNESGEIEQIIDMEKSAEIIDLAYASGINYYDTAYMYHKGESENAIGKLLAKYPRESFYLADKMPTWLVKNNAHAKTIFQDQLDKCKVKYFDYYLLHALKAQADYNRVYEEEKVYEYLAEEKAKGRIKNLGFSFHGDNAFFSYLIDKHEWDFIQIQVNYVDWKGMDAEFLYTECEKRNIPVIIMEPLKGGMLASLNKDSEDILKELQPNDSIATWAFRYVGSLPSVLTVLSGMTHIDHVKDNVKTYTNFKPLTTPERAGLERATELFLRYKQVPCTACSYCMPCPFGVDIPAVFAAYNKCVKESAIPDMNGPKDANFESKKKAFLETYYKEVPEGGRAENCVGCGKCQKVCPQKIQIADKMLDIKAMVIELEK